MPADSEQTPNVETKAPEAPKIKKKRTRRPRKLITSKTLDETKGAEAKQVEQLLNQLSSKEFEGAKSLIMAPCLSCPLENRCGPDPTLFSKDPNDCALLPEWAIWSHNVHPILDYLLKNHLGAGEKSVSAADKSTVGPEGTGGT